MTLAAALTAVSIAPRAASDPAQPTVQREVCEVPGFQPQPTDSPTQLDSLDLPAVWRLSRGAGQRVAVIDTGVAPHRRLPGLAGGGDYVGAGDGTRDCDGHGTLVAGIIAATADPESDRFSGVAPQARLIGIRQSSTKFAFVADRSRPGVGDVATLAEAVRTAADLGASVINISTVACESARAGADDRGLGAALAYAVDVKGAVIVTAAGNAGDAGHCPGSGAADVVVSPARYDEYVLAVGSVDVDGNPSAFTMPGPWMDVAAPGEAVLSLSTVGDAVANTVDGQRDPVPICGTGYAAAVVSGLAALIRSRFPDWTPGQVMDRIKATARHPPGGRNDLVGAGPVDPLAAMSTDAPPAGRGAGPDVAVGPAAPTAPAQPPGVEPAGRRTALHGVAALLVALTLTLAIRWIRSNPSGRAPG